MATEERPRIAVVDDDHSVRLLLSVVLSRAGYEVMTYWTAEACLEELDQKQPQLMIVDRVLPGMDGIDLFRAARARLPSVQGILISGFPSAGVKERTVDAGLSEYVLKPFRVADLLAVCEAAMKMVPAGAPAR